MKVEVSKKVYEIDHCYHQCPFFGVSMDGMQCDHPFFDDKPVYENMIISHSENIQNGFPSKCPLINNQKEYTS